MQRTKFLVSPHLRVSKPIDFNGVVLLANRRLKFGETVYKEALKRILIRSELGLTAFDESAPRESKALVRGCRQTRPS